MRDSMRFEARCQTLKRSMDLIELLSDDVFEPIVGLGDVDDVASPREALGG
jgi:hypothetical protein